MIDYICLSKEAIAEIVASRVRLWKALRDETSPYDPELTKRPATETLLGWIDPDGTLLSLFNRHIQADPETQLSMLLQRELLHKLDLIARGKKRSLIGEWLKKGWQSVFKLFVD